MKFRKSTEGFILALALPLVGCSSSVEETAHVIDADKAKGTVDIGFIHDATWVVLNDGGRNANWVYAEKEAQKVCQKWGYKSAEKLSDIILNENQLTNDGSYISQKFWIKMQCIVNNEHDQ